MFKRALHFSTNRGNETSLMDEPMKEIFTEAMVEFEEEFSPRGMGKPEERSGRSGSSAA